MALKRQGKETVLEKPIGTAAIGNFSADNFTLTSLTLGDEKEVRTVKISIQGGKRNYQFTGNWTGNDVRLVMSSFFKEYRLYIRALRRQGTNKF